MENIFVIERDWAHRSKGIKNLKTDFYAKEGWLAVFRPKIRIFAP